MQDALIRSARASDLVHLRRIEAAAAAQFAAVGMPDIADPHPDDLMPEAFASACLARRSLWVATQKKSSEPIAFLAACPMDDMTHIAEVDVHPQHAGHHLGARLIATATGWARAQNHKGVTLTTFKDVPWNAPYYRRLGFEDWPAKEWGADHRRIWEAQAKHLDITKRAMMIFRL